MSEYLPGMKLSHLISFVKYEVRPGSKRGAREMWMNLPSGLPMYPTVEATDFLQGWIGERGIYGSAELDPHYYIKVIEASDGSLRVYLKYQQILGSYHLCTISREELLEMLPADAPAAQEVS